MNQEQHDTEGKNHPNLGPSELNVLGTELKPCCFNPLTGFFRDGFCHTSPEDLGIHTVCIEVTEKFLKFSKEAGNDLSTPVPQIGFKGLKEGDRWCLCASRWIQAEKKGYAPRVYLESTHEETLAMVSLDILKKYSI
jgi:uncharacterized protein